MQAAGRPRPAAARLRLAVRTLANQLEPDGLLFADDKTVVTSADFTQAVAIATSRSIPAMPIAESSAEIVVGISVTNSATSTGTPMVPPA